jgi:hypothetical protein
MSTFLTLADAAQRLGITRQEVRESKRFSIVSNPGTEARVLKADVVRVERQREDGRRQEEIRAACRPASLAAKIADDERWLASIRAKGGSSLVLDDLHAELEANKAELEQLRVDEAARRAPGPRATGPCEQLHRAALEMADELRREDEMRMR